MKTGYFRLPRPFIKHTKNKYVLSRNTFHGATKSCDLVAYRSAECR